ncbi:MAG TPA: Calx-beta domain-containing protein [Woeseiaceae bacterium]|nr:Calx-beta domain-containing protein [Woeseiaceae bacterium]
MKKNTAKRIPLYPAVMAPSAALTSALLGSVALGATGDLDPSFGDVGRLGPILDGPVWSLAPQEDGKTLLAGGIYYQYYYYYYTPIVGNFVNLLTADGSSAPEFSAPTLEKAQVLDLVRQPDGRVVVVGRKFDDALTKSQLLVARLQSDGSLDPAFGSAGVFALPAAANNASDTATSVVLDPDGRIVVAGLRGGTAIVVRLLPNGSLDDSFATSGVFDGPESYDYYVLGGDILRTEAGGYRVTLSNYAGCQVFALTAAGTLDSAFGTAGIATVAAPSLLANAVCNSMTAQQDELLLVAGRAENHGFAGRLLANGQPDPGFSAAAIRAAMSDATAIAVGDNGTVLVAGRGVSGASIMRLQASGELDAMFGKAGTTVIDLQSAYGGDPVVHDMFVAANGSVMAAGGADYSQKAFVIRLLGSGGGDSPGVLGWSRQNTYTTAEGANEVVLNVRRTGGSSGSVSLAYQSSDANLSASSALDYGEVSGRLTWADGDSSEQQIRVPILSDSSVEPPEYFEVLLNDAQGGAGLGTSNTTIEIAADGGPYGQISFTKLNYNSGEKVAAQVEVSRDYYSSGAVSVTLTPVAGTATAVEDFAADPVTVSWADGESGWKIAKIPIVDDTLAELDEAFNVELSNPAGGAIIGQISNATVRIQANDQVKPNESSTGGGSSSYLSLLLLGLMSLLRSLRMRFRRHS